MVATSHPLASEAGAAILREGGTAVEAAVCAAAVLAVVEPHMTGIGGDCFALIGHPDGRLEGLNGAGRSAAALDPGSLHGTGDHLDAGSPHAVTVPGAVAAWATLAARGSLGLDRLLAPAIRLAEEGFPLGQRVAADWAGCVDRLADDEGARAHYLTPEGRAPTVGQTWRLPALAETLRRIARDGAQGFYAGPMAEEIAETLAAKGDGAGTIGMDDLAAHGTEFVEPLTRPYAGHEVVELPPANQGVTALAMLGIMERHDPASLPPGSADALHLEIEASRLAYAQRDAELADPDAMERDAGALLAPDRLNALAERIGLARAGPALPNHRTGTDTVYLCAVDRDGLAVSLINSLFHAFGSAICTPRSGVMLQNRGCGFRLDPAHPNAIAPGKRPLHTLIPGLLTQAGKVRAAFGVMGGQYQAHGHAHVTSLMLDHGLDPQAALDAPRVFHEGVDVLVERGVPPSVAGELAARGHRVKEAPSAIGGGQVIAIDWRGGVLTGGSDPRKDGCAIGLA